MDVDDLATKVIAAVQNNPTAISAISDALASGNPVAIQEAVSQYAGITISAEDAQVVADRVRANPSQPAAYGT